MTNFGGFRYSPLAAVCRQCLPKRCVALVAHKRHSLHNGLSKELFVMTSIVYFTQPKRHKLINATQNLNVVQTKYQERFDKGRLVRRSHSQVQV